MSFEQVWQALPSRGQTLDTLEQNETLLWEGKPVQGILWKKSNLLFLPFSLLWGIGLLVIGFYYPRFLIVELGEAGLLNTLWALPFFMMGLYFLLGHLLWDAFIRGHLHYKLTNQRVIISGSFFRNKIHSIPLEKIRFESLHLVPGRGNVGDICFKKASWLLLSSNHHYDNRYYPLIDALQGPSLYQIENAKEVYQQIQSLLDNQGAATETQIA